MATEAEFWGRPMEPGTVRDEPTARATRARVVREALRHLATDPTCCKELPHADREAAWRLATVGADETLEKLGRLLKRHMLSLLSCRSGLDLPLVGRRFVSIEIVSSIAATSNMTTCTTPTCRGARQCLRTRSW
jgi:hypothetical protein